MKLIQDMSQLLEGKEQQIARLKDDYDNAMRWVMLPADKVPDHEKTKWKNLADKLKTHAKNQFKIDLDESVQVNEDASDLEEGDPVEITGNVEHQGEKGTIERFGSGKKFVVVKFEDGSNASFHSSDVSKTDDMYDGEDDTDEDEDPDTFYVAFYDEDEERSWIGMVTREGGGKWHEKRYKGEAHYRWGQSYMSYLSAHDIMSWIHKDYRRGMEIEGPFFDAKEAEEYVNHNWGNLEKRTDESLDISADTSARDLLKMVAEQQAKRLLSLRTRSR